MNTFHNCNPGRTESLRLEVWTVTVSTSLYHEELRFSTQRMTVVVKYAEDVFQLNSFTVAAINLV